MVKGIDVSNHQGVINFRQVKQAGYEFVFIKATEGTNFRDRYFPANWYNAHAEGFICGAYHYMKPKQNPDARTEADYFYDYVTEQGALSKGDMLVLDAETLTPADDGPYGNWCTYWLQIIESYFLFKPLCYTGQDYINRLHLTSNPDIGNYGLWLASWVPNSQINNVTQANIPPAPAPWPVTAFWQYTAYGRVPGISGDCDLDMFNGNMEQLLKYGFLGTEKPPTPEIDVAAVLAQLDIVHSNHEDIVTYTNKIKTSIEYADEALENARRLLGGSDTPT